MKNPYPKYVMFSIDGKPNCAMRLEKDDDFGTRKPRWRYYRDAGNWSIRFKKEDGKLITEDERYNKLPTD